MDRGELKKNPAGRGGQGDEVLNIGIRPAEIAFADVAYGARYGTIGVFPYLLGEGLNNRIKTLKKVSNGCLNFERFRKRDLLIMTYSKKGKEK